MSENAILRELRDRRRLLGISMQSVYQTAGINHGTFTTRERTLRCGTLEQIERWAAALGYRLVLVPMQE